MRADGLVTHNEGAHNEKTRQLGAARVKRLLELAGASEVLAPGREDARCLQTFRRPSGAQANVARSDELAAEVFSIREEVTK